jgi:aspartate/methionine/tyrosine aminotransferase
MTFPDVDYIRWAKEQPPAHINLARSGVALCPPELLQLRARDLVVNLPVRDGYAPLVAAIARRYRVTPDQVFTVSGGTSFADWFAAAVVLERAHRGDEVIIEQPAYEPLLRIAEGFGVKIKRFDRRFENDYAIDLDAVTSSITPRTRLAMVTNLHNPSGARIDSSTLEKLAAALEKVGAFLLVDEVYVECLFGKKTESAVHAGPNVIAANSLTKAYGLDGLRAGWLLGPPELIERAWRMQDLLANNGVAPGEQLALAAFRHLPAIRGHAHKTLDPNLRHVRDFFAREPRLRAFVPGGGNVVFPQLPPGITGDAFSSHLLRRYSTLVVPGRFFESPRHFRISFGCHAAQLERGLKNISRALDDLSTKKPQRLRDTETQRTRSL